MNINRSAAIQRRQVSVHLRLVAWFVACMVQSSMMSFAQSPQARDAVPSKPGPAGFSLPRLTAQEQQQLKLLKNRLVTPLNSKENPGDRDTWFVLGFMDAAVAETRSREATPLGLTGVMWSDHQSTQRQVVKDAIVVQGRTAAALAVLQYLNSPNAAVARLRSPSNATRDGWLKRQGTQAAANRLWVYQAFANETDARHFLENVRSGK